MMKVSLFVAEEHGGDPTEKPPFGCCDAFPAKPSEKHQSRDGGAILHRAKIYYAGAMATAGNIVFLGHLDGTFSAYDAKTLKELWSFNIGTGS
jgi:glucose dehydrogenase